MSILSSEQQTQLDEDALFLDDLILQSAESANSLAAVMTNGAALLWNLPIERLIPLLNANVPRTLRLFDIDHNLRSALNASLDGLSHKRFINRAVVPSRPDIQFIDGQFVYVPPVEEENADLTSDQP